MLEELKQKVYEANMLLPKYRSGHIHGEMTAALIARAGCLSLNQAVLTMRP